MFTIALALLLQTTLEPSQIEGPYMFREDQGQTTKVILKNGLTAIVREQQAVPLANVTTYVKAGYFDEDDRISGISHVIEHMFFKGTATRPVGEIARETKALGGYLNAYTYYDRTVYHTVVPSENVLKALDIQADALWRSTFDADELKREIEVVLQENNRKLDNPSAVTAEKLYETAFDQHRMKRWRIGTVDGLRALTRDDVVAYFTHFYRPSNIILTVVGQIDREKVLDSIVKLYGGAQDQKVERDAGPSEPEQTSTRFASQVGPIEQAHVAVGYHVPGISSPETRTLEVLAAVLSDGRASRLNEYLRDEKQLITSGSAGVLSFAEVGFFVIDAQTARPLDAQIGILAEVENIKRYGVTDESVARAKTLIAQRHLRQLETVNGVGEELAYYEALGDWKKSESYLSEIGSVTPALVVGTAKKYLTFENLSAFEYLPQGGTPLAADSYGQTVLQRVAAVTEQRTEQELPVTAQISTAVDAVTSDLVKPIQKRSILRGPDVYILEDHRLPLVSFGIFYPGGRLYESTKNAGVTELMLRTALRGTKRFNSSDIARRLENAGARIQVVNEPDFFGYILDAVSGRTDEAVEILMDVLQQPAFDDVETDREKVLQLARLKDLRENNYAYPVQLFMRTLFGEHPYAQPSVGNEDTVGKLTSDNLKDWFKINQRPLMPTIIIVGDARGTGLVASIADTLTNEDLHERDMGSLSGPQLKREQKQTVEPARRHQTAIVYGFPSVSRSDPDRSALVVLQNIVSGLGGRFFDAIREKQGLAYSVHTQNTFFAKSGAVFTYTAFSPENEDKVKAALEKEIERLRTEGVTADELKKGVAYSIGEHEIGLQSRTSQVLEYARSLYAGAGVNAVSGYSDAIRRVTADALKSAAQKYLEPANSRVAIVRGGNQ